MDTGNRLPRSGFYSYDSGWQPRSSNDSDNPSAPTQRQHWPTAENEPPNYGEFYATLPASFRTSRLYPNEPPPPYSRSPERMPQCLPNRLREDGGLPQPVRHPVIRSSRSDRFSPRTRPTDLPFYSAIDDTTSNSNVTNPEFSFGNRRQTSHVTHHIPIFHQSGHPVCTQSMETIYGQGDMRHSDISESSTSIDPSQNSSIPQQEISPRASNDNIPPTSSELIEKALEELDSIRVQVDAFISTEKDKQYLCLEDKLDKLLLSIDRIDCAGDQQLRQRRRQITNDVINAITVLESKLSTTVGTTPSVSTNPCDSDVHGPVSLTGGASCPENE